MKALGAKCVKTALIDLGFALSSDVIGWEVVGITGQTQ